MFKLLKFLCLVALCYSQSDVGGDLDAIMAHIASQMTQDLEAEATTVPAEQATTPAVEAMDQGSYRRRRGAAEVCIIDQKQGKCVPYYRCKSPTAGEGAIDLTYEMATCVNYIDVCCLENNMVA